MYLEGLAEYRRSLGLPGLAIGWGTIGEVGYLARNAEIAQSLVNRTGFKLISPKQAMAAIERLLGSDVARVGAISVDWQRLRVSAPTANSPRFAGLIGKNGGGDVDAQSANFAETLKGIPAEERLPA